MQLRSPGIHIVIDEWIDHGVAHGEPVECEEDVLDVAVRVHLTINVLINEVSVIWKPAEGEEEDNNDEHPNNLIFFSRENIHNINRFSQELRCGMHFTHFALRTD